MSETLHAANVEAEKEIMGKVPEVISEALNKESFEIEKEMGQDVGMVPFDDEDIEQWMEEDDELFDPGEIDEEKDIEWNDENIKGFFKTGILLGLTAGALISYIVSGVVGRNRESFFRRVYNIISGAYEEGRQIAMLIAKKRGVEIEKEWNATKDFKTRDAHRQLDGQRVPVDEAFSVDGETIRFPRDPQAKAYLRCNCRCAMKRTRAHWQYERKMRENIRDKEGIKPIIQGMSYDEWYQMKQKELGKDQIEKIIKEMKRDQAKKAYRKRKRKQKQGGGK